jgi:hypothetical protein
MVDRMTYWTRSTAIAQVSAAGHQTACARLGSAPCGNSNQLRKKVDSILLCFPYFAHILDGLSFDQTGAKPMRVNRNQSLGGGLMFPILRFKPQPPASTAPIQELDFEKPLLFSTFIYFFSTLFHLTSQGAAGSAAPAAPCVIIV